MKRPKMLILLAAVVVAALAAPIEPALVEQMDKLDQGERVGVMIVLDEQLDAETIIRTIKDKQERWNHTVTTLKAMAEQTQAGLLAELRQAEARGDVADIRPMWIANAVYCEAVPEVVYRVAERPEVRFVQWDLVPTENALAVEPNPAGADALDGSYTIEWNVSKVKADSVWWVHGYTGDGVVVGDIDTGCDYTHPDLAGHMWTDPNYPNHGWDFENNDNDPMDSNGHGTHTCGTVAGDGTGGDTTGMAPRAQIMSTRTKTSISQPYPDTIAENTVMNSMQFCVAPPLSPDNHAHLLTMSLGWIIRLWSPRQALWRQCVGNVAAAGLPYFIAAGNEGNGNTPINLRCPGHAPSPWHHPAAESGGLGGSISIGATDNNDNIASFSSWGPVTWDTIDPYFDYAYPPGLLKPDFSAPGVNITSTRRGGGYTQMSGTSMATPCAAGVCALMLEKNPSLLPEEVDEIMQYSVEPLGAQPKNNTFGTGRIDAMRCIENTPFPGPRHDVAIGAVLAPADTIYPLEPLAPTVVVVNRGDFVETNVVVHCRVDSAGGQVYSEQFTIASLDSAGADTVELPAWTAGGGGQTYDLTFWHAHPPDTINGNDTARAQAWSRDHDVALVGANIGPEVRAHRPLRPAAFIGNVGGFSEAAFNVTCRVDSSGITVYDETVSVDSIPKRDTVNVIFPVWPVGPDSAVYDVTFFHDVGPDQHRANDTLEQRTRASADLIRVALELKQGSIGRTPPNAVFAIESLCNDAGWHTQIVTGTDVDELAELANFDVLVAGDPGFNDNDFNVYQHALLDWVRRGGAYVGLGWTVFGVYRKTGPWSAYDTVCAVQCTLDYAFISHGNVSIIDTTHDITRGVADFPVQDYGEYSAAGLWPGAVMLADYTNSPGEASVAYKLLGDGRSVYLGPVYFAHFGTHENEPYFADNNARRLLRQAIRWAASGPGLGVADAPGAQPLRARLAGIRPNPSDGRARVSYSLAGPCRVRLAVYDLAGQLVRTLVSGAQPAGERTVTWNRRDDAGRLVSAGVYFVRFEADGAVQNRKLVIR